ncbi:toll/interleukin-1 receptor domain-containing protein [Paraburkholderia sp. BL27I4N3]|uniref:toll/interleukin-1 receptor domain-containing protein n=1 Tax=Paraburkholderia sp. BL27I4N3 TaxID=1938805 RepID=UPI001C6E4369|nr:toll/interleukin-1 receptor domain-containing protein [Paraburkholderia sp. BL27I4N3]
MNMPENENQKLIRQIRETVEEPYAERVRGKHSKLAARWPVVSGCNLQVGHFKGWMILLFKHTGVKAFRSNDGMGLLTPEIVGAEAITRDNVEFVRRRMVEMHGLAPEDALIFWPPEGFDPIELDVMMLRHETARGLIPMKIFLSHKSADKPLVRQFKQLLDQLGFDPWLDEDAMSAGAELERALLKGFSDSCAAVFFITPNYKDENYLASEVDYAIQEKRKKGDQFQIITLVFSENGKTGAVPELLKRYVYKEPATHLSAFHEVLKALPLAVGSPYWKA